MNFGIQLIPNVRISMHSLLKCDKDVFPKVERGKIAYQWKESIIAPITRRMIKLTLVIVVGYHCYELHIKFYLISFS
jgi:hypothetical protein